MKKLIIVFVALLLTGGLAVIHIFDPFADQAQRFPSGLGDYPKNGSYQINPGTIIAALDRGETNVFTPKSATPTAYSSMLGRTSTPAWDGADYMKVAEALARVVWRESLATWSLDRLILDTSCRGNSVGFGIGRFIYFKPTWVNGQIVYTTREIDMHPLDNEVSWGDGANFPHPIFGWKSVDMGKVRISVEDALTIAEESGGKTARQAVQDQCQISLKLSGDEGWQVWYDDEGGLPIYEAHIDPNTSQVLRQLSAP